MKKNYLPRILMLFIAISCYAFTFTQVPSDFPSITTEKTGETAPGYVLLTVSSDVEGIGYYVLMIDDEGNPFKYKKLEDDYAYDFKVQPNGLLSYAQFLSHHSYTGGGNCVHIVMDEDMNIVDSIQMKNGYIAEAHDFQLLPNGHVLLFGYYLTQMDLSEIVDGGYPNAMVSGGIVQELDLDRNVVWQWRSWDHYDYKNYEFGRRSSRQTVSEFHLNTINLDTDGHMFLGTPSWTKKINRQTGEIMWHLGGDENEFTFVGVDSLEGVSDVTGHAFYRLENGNVLIYDNGPRRGSGTSEAHEYELDEENKIATKVKTFTPNSEIAAWHRGNAQRLPNGNTIVGWGGASGDPIPTCTEFDSLGNTVFKAYFDNPEVESYRAVRFPYPPEMKYEAFEEEAALGNIYDFFQGDSIDMGVEIEITDLVSIGYNELIVKTWDYAPLFPQFDERAPMVLPKKVILDEYSINFIGGEISFDTELFGIDNPEDITVYFRPTANEGVFSPLTTTYNPVKGEITASFDEFGEFIFAYPDLEHMIYAPVPRDPESNATVNFELPVELEWSQDGFFNDFSLQVSLDEKFDNLIVDESGLKSTVYEINTLEANTNYYWRVKMRNDAGESEWSEASTFTTVSPYVKLIAPNGNEVWDRGLDYFIEWESNFESELIVELYKDNQLLKTIDTVENIDAYYWSIPVDLDSTCNYYISINSLDNPMIQDASDVSFAINDSSCTGIEVPSLQIISPNGGELIRWGQNVEISWDNNTGESINVDLYKNGEQYKSLFTSVAENNIDWTVEEDTEKSDDYTIVISSTGSLGLTDASNTVFDVGGYPESTGPDIKTDFDLLLYPNPVKENLSIEFFLKKEAEVSIKLYNFDGRELQTILTGNRTAGRQYMEFNMSEFSPGTYILQFRKGNKIESKAFYFIK